MTSRRFPGKVLAPLNRKPVLYHVTSRVAEVVPSSRIVVVTSHDSSDDPIEAYTQALGLRLFRGSLDNVFDRFQSCLREHPCEWFFRVCADSPLLDAALFERALAILPREPVDLVTNVQVRTFPPGRSVELLRAETFARINGEELTSSEREHVTRFYYTHPERFRIVNFTCPDSWRQETHLAMDTVDDPRRLEDRVCNGTI
jgi:spore coat polysaccharide biosynthesis protein SpsF